MAMIQGRLQCNKTKKKDIFLMSESFPIFIPVIASTGEHYTDPVMEILSFRLQHQSFQTPYCLEKSSGNTNR